MSPEVHGTFCPDCGRTIYGDRDAFVAHREVEHPPAPRTIHTAGIVSQETVGTPGGGR